MSDPETILVPVDFSVYSRAAAIRACQLARVCGASVRFVHALHLPPVAHEAAVPEGFWSGLRDSERAKLEAFRHEFEESGLEISSHFEERDPVDMVLSEACSDHVVLIVMGTHGHRGLDRFLLGSVAERTLQRSPVPVMVVRDDEQEAARPISSILFATDFSEHAERAERIVAESAKLLNAQVEAFHAIRETAVLFAPYAVPGSSDFEGEMHEAASKRMEGVLARLREKGLSAKSKIAYGRSAQAILARAESTGADLIVMGARGYSTLQRFLLGSVVERVVRGAHCSVLVVPEEERS